MQNSLKTIFFLTILFIFACGKPECNVDDFIGTANGTWTQASGTCIAGFPNSFELKTNAALRIDEDVAIFITDSLAYSLILNGPNDEGCLFTLYNNDDNRQSLGSGILDGDNLTINIFDGNSSDTACSFSGKIEK